MICKQRLNVGVWPWVLAKLVLPVETAENAKMKDQIKRHDSKYNCEHKHIMFNPKKHTTVNLYTNARNVLITRSIKVWRQHIWVILQSKNQVKLLESRPFYKLALTSAHCT